MKPLILIIALLVLGAGCNEIPVTEEEPQLDPVVVQEKLENLESRLKQLMGENDDHCIQLCGGDGCHEACDNPSFHELKYEVRQLEDRIFNLESRKETQD